MIDGSGDISCEKISFIYLIFRFVYGFEFADVLCDACVDSAVLDCEVGFVVAIVTFDEAVLNAEVSAF